MCILLVNKMHLWGQRNQRRDQNGSISEKKVHWFRNIRPESEVELGLSEIISFT